MKRVALYMRVSSTKQVKEGDSIPAQRDALTKYAKEKGYSVAGEYLDDGVSGTRADRDELSRLLEDVKAGKIDIILCTKLDRLYRNIKHYLNMMEILDRHNVGWLAIWEPVYDTTTPQGRLIVNQMMSIAQFEAENTGQRIRQVQAYKLSQKEVISGTTTAGYRIENKHLVPDENAEYVKAAFEMYSACGNMNAVMREYGKKYGMPGTKPAFRRMLMSPLYKGEHYTGIKDYCPAIVSADLWDDVQRKLKMNIKKNQKETYIFSGLLRCAECGRVMGGNTRRRQRGNCYTITHDYRCTGYYARMPKQCINQKVATEKVIERELITKPLQAVTACKGKTLGGYTMAYTEQQKKAIYKYREKNPNSTRNRMTITMRDQDKERLQTLAEKTGESKSELVCRLIYEEAQRAGIDSPQAT